MSRITLFSAAENRNSVIDRVVGSDVDQVHSFHFNSCEGDWDRVDWLPLELPDGGHTEELIISIEELEANVIGNVELFTSDMSPVGLLEPAAPPVGFTVNLVPAETNTWTIAVPCDLLQNGNDRLYIRVTKANNNNFGTYRVISSVLSEPELAFIADEQECANEDFEVAVVDLPTGTTVTWTATVELGNGILPLINAAITTLPNGRARINSNVEGRMSVTATIINGAGCQEVIEQRFWIGRIPVVDLFIESPVGIDVQSLCPSLPLWLYGNIATIATGGISNLDWDNVLEVKWLSSNPDFQLIPTASTGNRRVTVIPSSIDNAFTNITLRVRNKCGWTEAYLQLRNGKRNSSTCIGEPDVTLGVYPNPTDDFIDIDIICLCGIEPTDPIDPNPDPQKYSISRVDVSDMFGNTRLSYEGKQIPINPDGKIRLNLSQLPVGNYVLKLIMQDKVYMKHVVKQ